MAVQSTPHPQRRFEDPAHVVKRLLSGDGVAMAAARDVDAYEDLRTMAHQSDGAGGCLVVTNPVAGSSWRSVQAPTMGLMTVEQRSTIGPVSLLLSCAQAVGTFVAADEYRAHLTQPGVLAALDAWDNPVVLRFMPTRIHVQCPAGNVVLNHADVVDAADDPVSRQQREVFELVSQAGMSWERAVARHCLPRNDFQPVGTLRVHPLSLDSRGALVIAEATNARALLRLQLPDFASTIDEAVAMLCALGGAADLRQAS